jgi:hypothetical protein
VSLKTCETETATLAAIRAVGLPATLFADVSAKVMASWRARVAMETPSLLRAHPEPIELTLLAAYFTLPGTREHRHAGGLADHDGAPDQPPQ